MNLTWKHFALVAAAIIFALRPVPEGLPQHAWYFFAIFAGVIVSLGAIFGAIVFAVFTVISLPWVLARDNRSII